MVPPTFPTFQQAYTSVLRRVFDESEYTVSPRGNASREVTDVSFRLSDPRARLPFLNERPVNVVFNLAEVLWYLAGRDDLDMIAYYAPRLRTYSRDGQRLTGTAYGPKLFDHGSNGVSQWSRVLDLLRADPDTKRAIVTFFRPEELAEHVNPDVSCTVAAQFLIREGRLHLSVFMRGNDAYVGMVSDVFAFTFIQEFAAALLGARLGHYTHHVVSMHVNDCDAHRVARLLAAQHDRAEDDGRLSPFSIPTDASWADITTVLEHEAALRTNIRDHTPDSIADTGLAPYWQNVLLLFEAYRQIRHTDALVSRDVEDALPTAYRWLLQRRWPDRTTQELRSESTR